MNSRTKHPEATPEEITRFADMLAALGTEVRLRIVRLLLSAHPHGMVVGDLQSELGIPASTLSHHLERLKAEGLVTVTRESTFLRYATNTPALEELLGFLFAECCARTDAVQADAVIACCTGPKRRRS